VTRPATSAVARFVALYAYLPWQPSSLELSGPAKTPTEYHAALAGSAPASGYAESVAIKM
jgi:hypothetical protein